MIKAKEFYALTGVKRSTIRHYKEKNLIQSAETLDNGYSYYSNRELLDVLLIRNYRGMDFSIQQIEEGMTGGIRYQLKQMDTLQQTYLEKIRELSYKLSQVEGIKEILRQTLDPTQDIEYNYGKLLHYFWIDEAMQQYPLLAQHEIQHCIAHFPFVHICARASHKAFLAGEETIPLHLGYEFLPERRSFLPLYPEIYRVYQPEPCMLIRYATTDPLCIHRTDLMPLYEKMQRSGFCMSDDIIVAIRAAEGTPEHRIYYFSVRVRVKKAD